MALVLATNPVVSVAQTKPGKPPPSQSTPKAPDPFAKGALEVEIVDMNACTKDDYTLEGNLVIKASLSDMNKLNGENDQTDAVKQLLADQSAMDKLDNEWSKVARNLTSGQIKDQPDNVMFDVMKRLNTFAESLTKSTGVHFQIKSGGVRLSDDGPGCSLR
jgi:hypothetical protein